MAQVIADRRDVDFVLHEQLQVEKLSEFDKYVEFNKKTIDLIVSEARNLAVKEILPTQKIGDEKGVTLEQGQVKVPEEFHRIYQLFREGEWTAMTEDPEVGGQGMPHVVSLAACDYLIGANPAFHLYLGLTQGAGKLIQAFGTEELKNLFLKNVFTAKWAGTMLLTEPEAGSDVGALTTEAVKNDDGTYSISGTKIFISGGDQDMSENIIHPVLARLDDAPPGTSGVSLFIVPKYWVNPDGSLGEFNDVLCTGIEEKMGIHGNSTCTMTLGDKGKCRGYLLGKENKGMRQMFLMMNDARFLIALQGLVFASSAYLYAVNYARERKQGRHLLQISDKSASAVPIIEHPDVRRMLLTMKAYVEGMRSLMYYFGYCQDRLSIAETEEEQKKYQGIIDVLIPICKGYCTDRAFDICNMGIQVYGGYGYIREYPMEQLLRDCRITMIYEGTNGIQAMDLMSRKLNMQAFSQLLEMVEQRTQTAAKMDQIADYAKQLQELAAAVRQGTDLLKKRLGEDIMFSFASAYPLLEVCGEMCMAWMLLWRAEIACQKLEKAKKKDEAFYQGQLSSLSHFMQSILPLTWGKLTVIKNGSQAVVNAGEEVFGGK